VRLVGNAIGSSNAETALAPTTLEKNSFILSSIGFVICRRWSNGTDSSNNLPDATKGSNVSCRKSRCSLVKVFSELSNHCKWESIIETRFGPGSAEKIRVLYSLGYAKNSLYSRGKWA
jgi:hypothetical protein